MNHVFAYAMFLSVWFIYSPAQLKYWAPKERIYWVTTYTMIAKDFELKTAIDWLLYMTHNFLLFWLEESSIQHNTIWLLTKFFVWRKQWLFWWLRGNSIQLTEIWVLDPIYLYRVQLMDSGKGHVRVRDIRRGEVRSSIYVQFISWTWAQFSTTVFRSWNANSIFH